MIIFAEVLPKELGSESRFAPFPPVLPPIAAPAELAFGKSRRLWEIETPFLKDTDKL